MVRAVRIGAADESAVCFDAASDVADGVGTDGVEADEGTVRVIRIFTNRQDDGETKRIENCGVCSVSSLKYAVPNTQS